MDALGKQNPPRRDDAVEAAPHFDRLAGHEAHKRVLTAAALSGRVAHAYLFSGPEGVGKRLCALAFARLLNCTAPEDEEQGRACPSCRKIERNTHPDVFVLEPEGSKEIKVGQIREQVEERLQRTPVEGRYKVAVVDDAHRMNAAAQNAFLKTLEEPPPRTVMVLVTEEPGALLPTVRSRCQHLVFSPLPLDEVSRELEARGVLAGQEALEAAAIAGGSLGRALRMDGEALALAREAAARLGGTEWRGSAARLLDYAASLPVGGGVEDVERLGLVFDVLHLVLHEALRLRLGMSTALPMGSPLHEAAAAAAEGHGTEALVEMARMVEEARERTLAAGSNKLLILENLWLRLARVGGEE